MSTRFRWAFILGLVGALVALASTSATLASGDSFEEPDWFNEVLELDACEATNGASFYGEGGGFICGQSDPEVRTFFAELAERNTPAHRPD